jgi:Tol biopolymer transport system component
VQSAAPSWTGARLGAAGIAWTPRMSPDGRSLAFLVFVDGLSQVAVMNPESGNWTVLTKDRTRGYVSRVAWSRDGARIYYDRFTDVPLGVYSVPAIGGDERLLLNDANGAEPLADGSLIVSKMSVLPRRRARPDCRR